jgi:sucrose-6-phosphate hydrolase SacC (GH32 family)
VRAAGWAGVMSLPRLLVPRSDGRLGMQPVPELRALRGQQTSLRDVALVSPRNLDVSGGALEIVAEIVPGTAAQVGISVRRTPDGAEQTVVVYDTIRTSLGVDRDHSSLDSAVEHGTRWARLELGQAEPLSLHIFVDHSVVEVFANGRVCVASRVYPTRSDSLGVNLFARAGSAHVNALDVWAMAPVWPGAD